MEEETTNKINIKTTDFHYVPQQPEPCPHCGRCPTCGRGGYGALPYYPRPYPFYYETWPQPWISTTGGNY